MFFPAEMEPDPEEGEVDEDDETDEYASSVHQSHAAVKTHLSVIDHKVESTTQACCRLMCPEHLYNSWYLSIIALP